MGAHDNRWRVWDSMESYGQVLYQRATGEAQEMESSKAAATRLKGVLREGDHLLDVGCGAGHYLRSLRSAFPFPFTYTGIDATEGYIVLAKKAFADDPRAAFEVGDIEQLPYEDRSADVVLCCNVLLHLPRIGPAMQELWRVTKRTLVIRTLVGHTSFRIQQIREWEDNTENGDPLFDAHGEPHRFHYFNIYSKEYMEWMCSQLPGVKRWEIDDDHDFDPSNLTDVHWPDKEKPRDLTHVQGGWQVNGYIIEPWVFIHIERS